MLQVDQKKSPGAAGAFGIEQPTMGRLYGNVLLGRGLRAVDQFDVGHRLVVAGAEAALEDAQVAARALRVARAAQGEPGHPRFLVAHGTEGGTALGTAICPDPGRALSGRDGTGR